MVAACTPHPYCSSDYFSDSFWARWPVFATARFTPAIGRTPRSAISEGASRRLRLKIVIFANARSILRDISPPLRESRTWQRQGRMRHSLHQRMVELWPGLPPILRQRARKSQHSAVRESLRSRRSPARRTDALHLRVLLPELRRERRAHAFVPAAAFGCHPAGHPGQHRYERLKR